jgi:hypothetical protein
MTAGNKPPSTNRTTDRKTDRWIGAYDPDELLTISQLAALFGFSKRTLWRWTRIPTDDPRHLEFAPVTRRDKRSTVRWFLERRDRLKR